MRTCAKSLSIQVENPVATCPVFLVTIPQVPSEQSYGYAQYAATANPLWPRIVFWGCDNTIQVLDVDTNTLIGSIPYVVEGPMRRMAYSPATNKLFTRGNTGTVEVASAVTLTNITSIADGPIQQFLSHCTDDDKVYWGRSNLGFLHITRRSATTYASGATDDFQLGAIAAYPSCSDVVAVPSHGTVFAVVYDAANNTEVRVLSYADLNTPVATLPLAWPTYQAVKDLYYVPDHDIVILSYTKASPTPATFEHRLLKLNPSTGAILDDVILTYSDFIQFQMSYMPESGLIGLYHRTYPAANLAIAYFRDSDFSYLCEFNNQASFQIAEWSGGRIYVPNGFSGDYDIYNA